MSMDKAAADRATPEPAAFTVDEFCTAHRIGRAFFYKLVQQGRGPRSMKVGRRRLIPLEEAARWRRRMVAEAESPGAGVQ